MLAEKHAIIFEQIETVLRSKVRKMRRPNPDIEVDEFKSRAYEILANLDLRLHTLVIEKETSGLVKDHFYDPTIHSEKMLLDTACKYLIKSFVNSQIKKAISRKEAVEVSVSGEDVEGASEKLVSWPELDTDRFISGMWLLKKINKDSSAPDALSAQLLTQYHFLKALAKAVELAVKEYDISYVAEIENGKPKFDKFFYFVLWKEMPRIIASELATIENPLVKKSLQRLCSSEQALKKRVSRYFNEYKGGVASRKMKS